MKEIYMRVEATSRNSAKVGMTNDELDDLRRAAASRRDDIIIQPGAYLELRASEVPQLQPRHIKQESDQYRIRVPEGKATANGEGKPRDAFLASDVGRDFRQYQTAENIAPRDPFVELIERSVRAAVKRTAEQTGDEDYRQASSHDLRRRYAQRLLVEKEINP